MGKKHSTRKKKKLIRLSTARNEPSTSSSNDFAADAQADGHRVPPLPELPRPPAESCGCDRSSMSNRQKKQLMKLQMQSNKEGPGHWKIRIPAGVPLTSCRVPPIENVPNVACRLSADAPTDRPSVEDMRSASSSLRSALADNDCALDIQHPITRGFLRKQLKLALKTVDDSSPAANNSAAKSSAGSSQNFVPAGDPVPSLIFTPTEKGEHRGTEQSRKTLSSNDDSCATSRKDVTKVSGSKSKKKTGKLDSRKKVADLDEKMELLARAVENIRLDDEETVSVSPPQAFLYNSDISDSTVVRDDQTRAGVSGTESVSTKPRLAGEDRAVSKCEDDLELAKERDEMRNSCMNAFDLAMECIVQVEKVKDKIVAGEASFGGLRGVPAASLLATIVDHLHSTTERLGTALEIKAGVGAKDVAVQRSDIVQSETDVTPENDCTANELIEAATHLPAQCSQVGGNDSALGRLKSDASLSSVVSLVAANTQEKALIQPGTVLSDVKSGDTVVEDGSTPRDKTAVDKSMEALAGPKASSQIKSHGIPIKDCQSAIVSQKGTVKENGDIRSVISNQTAVQTVSHRRKARGRKKRNGGQQTNSAEGAAVEGSEKKANGDVIPAAEDEIVFDEKQKAILGEILTHENLQLQLIAKNDFEADKTASVFDLNVNPRPLYCPAGLNCLEASRLRSHLSTCWIPFCKVKYCWQMTQVIGHWIHCVERNCEVCPPIGKNDAEKVRKKVDWLSQLTDQTDLRACLMEQQEVASGLCNFLTSEGQHVILAYFIEYYFEAFMAYNELLRETGQRALEFIDEQLSENMIDTVRHSCNCLPLNNCRDNQCYRLRMVIAHWSKWNGLCHSTECNFCDRIYKRSGKQRGEISELVKFIGGPSKSGKPGTLMLQLIEMVKKPEVKEPLNVDLHWRESNRRDFRNACVNICIFADAGYGELEGNADEVLDLASVFNHHSTYQLLVLSRYILYKAISFVEEQLFVSSSTLASYYVKSMDEGVKLISAVHTFVKKELSLFDDSWESGNEVLSSCNITRDRRYLMLLSSKMGNKMNDFAAAMYH